MPDPQPAINTTQTRYAIFLVYGVNPGPEHAAQVRRVCSNLDGLQRSIATREPDSGIGQVVGIASDAWNPLFGQPRPAELHPFREFRAGPRYAPATPGDLFFHVTSNDLGTCYELAAQVFAQLGESVTLIDETHGFRYFDGRDLTGFVDGTENPLGDESVAATIVGEEDSAFAGGSYVMIQKYIHDHPAWNSLTTEVQEGIIGRRKLDDVELADDVKPPYAHVALTVIEENGEEIQIRRHNMPFGSAGGGESGTYFIGYARSPRPIEQMLENMVVGRPPGTYDRLLDFTHPVTGGLFFVPSLDFLAALDDAEDESAPEPAGAPSIAAPATTIQTSRRGDGSLNIGSLRGTPQHG